MTETDKVLTIRKLWPKQSGASIASQLGVSYSYVYRIAQREGLTLARKNSPEPESPTEDEISERAAEIRRGWSRSETEKRIVGGSRPRSWRPPVVRVSEFAS